ncbi:MAG: hypothetical protein J7L23_00915 [Candidatus Diapherotrites archaeon]|nr:hypothetical protein [Candidatus Diapherotrites archaeon]
MALKRTTIELANELIDWYAKSGNLHRKVSLEAFRDAYNVRTSYEGLKDLMLQLSYASIPLEGGKFDLRKVPKTHRRRVEALREELKKGNIDIKQAEAAARKFLAHPLGERMRDLNPMEDEEIERMQKRFELSMNKAMSILTESMNAHPARAYSIMWKALGGKIHDEIPIIMRSSNKGELRDYLRKFWNVSYLKADAFVQYKKADSHIIDLYKNHLDDIPDEALRHTVENLYRSVRRYPWGKRKSAIPTKSKAGMSKRDFINGYKSFGIEIRLKPEEAKLPEYKKKLILFGRHLNAGTAIYKEAMKKRKEIGPLIRAKEKMKSAHKRAELK